MRKIIIILLILWPFIGIGQISFSGIIQDENSPVEFANIVVLDNDSIFIKGTVSDEKGAFELSLTKGIYKLVVSHINYPILEKEIDVSAGMILEPIILSSDGTELDEVVVTATKAIIRREIDKTIINIENSPMAQSSNVFDALKSAPGLVIMNDEISMLGKSSVRISIDGRIIEMSGRELSDFLRTLSASNTKEFEIITNPSARYEAEGNSGIVNIITKRINKNAWSNQFTVTYNQAKLGWQNISNNFSYQKNKVSLLVSLPINVGHQYWKQTVKPNYSIHPVEILSQQDRNEKSISPRILLDYNLDENTTIGIQYLGSFYKLRTLDDIEITVFDHNFDVTSYLFAEDAQFNFNRNNSSMNLYFDKKLDSLGRRITLNVDVLDFGGSTINDLLSKRHDAELNFIELDFGNLGKAEHDIQNYSAKVDIEHPTSLAKLSYGARLSFSNTIYKLDNFNTISGTPVFTPLQSNTFNFQENIQSIYGNYLRKINDKWEIQAGLRVEYTQTNGVSSQNEIETPLKDNDYLELFPTFYIKHLPNQDNVFQLNYGRRINRPAYYQLNPARSFLSSQSFQQGNPFLLPSFSNGIELIHTFKHNLTSTLSLQKTTNNYSFIFDLDDESEVQTITYKNLFNSKRVSLMESFHIDIASWWQTQNVLFLRYSVPENLLNTDYVVLKKGVNFYGSINNVLTLNKAKTIIGEVNFWYDSPNTDNFYTVDQAYALDVSLSLKSLIKGMNITIGGHDILNSSARWMTSTVNNVENNFKMNLSFRYVHLSLSYRFGNDEISTQERSFGNEDVRRRSN